jgi:RNA polymerase sigma-70 factor (ECF subfamily)
MGGPVYLGDVTNPARTLCLHKNRLLVRGIHGALVDQSGIDALRAFYESHAQALFTYALALTRDRTAAEDSVHDAICRLLGRAALPSELRPYAFRCVRNAALDVLRKVRPAEPLGLLDLESDDGGAFDRTLCAQVESHLFELPQDEMETLVLRLCDGLSFREIAEVKGAPLNTVASWYRRGVARLRERVNGDETCGRSKTS